MIPCDTCHIFQVFWGYIYICIVGLTIRQRYVFENGGGDCHMTSKELNYSGGDI